MVVESVVEKTQKSECIKLHRLLLTVYMVKWQILGYRMTPLTQIGPTCHNAWQSTEIAYFKRTADGPQGLSQTLMENKT